MKHELHQCMASRVRRLSRIVDGYLREFLSDYDVTENQLNILFVLYKMGTIEQGIVGKKLYLERSTVSRAVNLLQKQDYIAKSSDYRPEIRLTKKGRQMVEEIIPFWEQFMDKVCDKIGKEGLQQFAWIEEKIS